jgi:WD40 repeat protein
MDSREVVARFEAERQALALMDHRGIARVFDGGVTASGQPFFAMELVAGLPIVRYCDLHRLAIRQRVELLMEVCHAVQHAHQKGVIHRDLKPANILVISEAGHGLPKVIDFGIAKAIGSELTEQTLFTRHNQVLGTPAYMSPEQSVQGAIDIDTRTDIYSLGAILYELLVGLPPRGLLACKSGQPSLELSGTREVATLTSRIATMDQVRLEEVAMHRQTTAAGLKLMVRSELEWIALKALEPERARRYSSASDLALDLQRYLAGEVVGAGPPSVAYRCRKFVRKHRVAVWLACGFVLSLLLAAMTSLVFGLQAHRERKHAEVLREAETARRQEAQEAREDLRKRNYVADMGLVQDALRGNNLAQAREVLLRHRPRAGESDFRGWEWRYLWEASRIRARSILPDQQKPIRSLSVSRDARWLAWGDDVGVIGVCEVASGQIKMLEAGAGDPAIVSFATATDALAAGVKRDLVKVWAGPDWTERLALPQEGWTRAIAFAPSGESLACMTDALQVQLWQLAQTHRLGTAKFGALRDFYKCRMAFAPHEPVLALGESDGMVRILELPSLQERHRFRGTPNPSDGITALAFSPSDGLLVTAAGYNDFTIRVWQSSNGTQVAELPGHSGWVTALAFSSDGQTLASGSIDQTIRLWNWELRSGRSVLQGHQHEVSALAFAMSDVLASASRAGELFLWDVRQADLQSQPVLAEREGIRQAAFTRDSQSIIAWHGDGTLSWRSLKHPTQPRRWAASGTRAYGVVLSPDGESVAVGTRDGVIRLFNGLDISERGALAGDSNGRLLPVAYTRDARLLLGVARIEPIPVCYLWDAVSRVRLQSWALTPRNHRVAFSGDGALVATGDFDGTVRLWDARRGVQLSVLGSHQSEVVGLEFSPDDRVLASGSSSGDVVLWDVQKRTAEGSLRCQAGAIYSLGFSPDGRRLVTGGNWQRAIQIWDLATRQIVATLSGRGPLHDNTLFSANGDFLVSVNSDGALQIWQAPSLHTIESELQDSKHNGLSTAVPAVLGNLHHSGGSRK